jgi:hypothetical protein
MRNIDGDALLALRFEPIYQESKIEILCRCPMANGIFSELGELILED